MNFAPSSRITPWVLRLIAVNAVVLLLMRTIFISPELASALAFSPGGALQAPWTFLTYMFVHAGLLHLLGNMFMLFVFGTAVESRMGSRAFIFYYLLCGVGGAVFSLALSLSGIMSVGPMVGASGVPRQRESSTALTNAVVSTPLGMMCVASTPRCSRMVFAADGDTAMRASSSS